MFGWVWGTRLDLKGRIKVRVESKGCGVHGGRTIMAVSIESLQRHDGADLATEPRQNTDPAQEGFPPSDRPRQNKSLTGSA